MDRSHLDNLLNSELADVPPWKFVATPKLTKILDIHPQTAANWRHRAKGPPPAPSEWFKGRPIRYRIGHVLSWAYEQAGIEKQPWEIYGEWLRDNMGFEAWQDREAVGMRVVTLMRTDRRFRPIDLRRVGAMALDLA
ncbi:hypothetical protein [Brevundimonas sp.]|uniref:hypothetical protein n=1 Tax=Brevundimonas sp. TaxID=1871086 RepID=UPI0028B0B2CD|nr:hypothetical protein [Brevundimonas sp.]